MSDIETKLEHGIFRNVIKKLTLFGLGEWHGIKT